MLEVGTETFDFESGPDSELCHGIGLGSPDWEFIGIESELLLHSSDDGSVVEEEDL